MKWKQTNKQKKKTVEKTKKYNFLFWKDKKLKKNLASLIQNKQTKSTKIKPEMTEETLQVISQKCNHKRLILAIICQQI